MAVTLDEVRRIARLAHLEVTEEELPRWAAELGKIIDYVNELAEVDTANVRPSTDPASPRAPLRTDAAEVGFDRDAALSAAPRTHDGAFAVPAFVDES